MQDKDNALNPYLEGIVWIPELFILTKSWAKNLYSMGKEIKKKLLILDSEQNNLFSQDLGKKKIKRKTLTKYHAHWRGVEDVAMEREIWTQHPYWQKQLIYQLLKESMV